MAYTFSELKKKNVTQLREVAKEAGITGYTQLNKEHLLETICKTLNIDMYVHHQVKGIDKAAIKMEIKKLKKERDGFIQDKKNNELKQVRQKIKKLKNKLRSATV